MTQITYLRKLIEGKYTYKNVLCYESGDVQIQNLVRYGADEWAWLGEVDYPQLVHDCLASGWILTTPFMFEHRGERTN